MFRTIRNSVVLFLFLEWALCPAHAGETDQYLAWGVELEDSSEAFNRFLNDEIEEFLRKTNSWARRSYGPEELTQDLYLYLFQGLYSSRVRKWVKHSADVDRFPDDSVSSLQYRKMSIYRDLSIPHVILPLARTIRLNDVYLGIDKIGHFFGFGRRYYKRYLRFREEGLSEQEAMERVVLSGIHLEDTLVGKVVDGIFSHADLEADFQGFVMAKDLCDGENPYIIHDGEAWILAREIDIRKYITPDFDESYNNSTYWGTRRRNVLAILKDEYSAKRSLPEVQERIAGYRESVPSLSKKAIAEHFEAKGSDTQKAQSLDALCSRLE